jgi:hypothetical protein
MIIPHFLSGPDIAILSYMYYPPLALGKRASCLTLYGSNLHRKLDISAKLTEQVHYRAGTLVCILQMEP